MEIVIENMSKMYEEEEREIHFREQTDKKRRVIIIRVYKFNRMS
jgi:hypothetical protein